MDKQPNGESPLNFRNLRLRTGVSLLTGFLTAAQVGSATTLTVSNNSDSGAGSLRAQVAASNPGDTIVFDAGLSGGTITLVTGQIGISNSSLTVDGSALSSEVTLSANSVSRIFQIDAGASVILKSITFAAGNVSGDFGGAIRNDGTLVASRCNFNGNSTRGATGGAAGNNYPTVGGSGGGGGGFGGAIFSDGPALTLSSCGFSNNLAQGGNGGTGGVNFSADYDGANGAGPNGGAGGPNVSGTPNAGGAGGFGGGGGGGASSGANAPPGLGGTGGFGGGGGGTGGSSYVFLSAGGTSGPFGGAGGAYEVQGVTGAGGGGAGLGGAVFTQTGVIRITNCTFAGNSALKGSGAISGYRAGDDSGTGHDGTGVGGGWFNMSPHVTLANNVFTNNAATTALPDVFTTPALSMVLTNGNLQFKWSTNEPGFSVEYTPDLGQTNWQAVSGSLSTNGAFYVEIVTPMSGLFRLYYPGTPGDL